MHSSFKISLLLLRAVVHTFNLSTGESVIQHSTSLPPHLPSCCRLAAFLWLVWASPPTATRLFFWDLCTLLLFFVPASECCVDRELSQTALIESRTLPISCAHDVLWHPMLSEVLHAAVLSASLASTPWDQGRRHQSAWAYSIHQIFVRWILVLLVLHTVSPVKHPWRKLYHIHIWKCVQFNEPVGNTVCCN